MRILTVFTFLLISILAQTQNLNQFLVSDVFENALVAVTVEDVHSKELLFGFNEQLNLAPASVQKLVTTATALEILGHDFQFETKIAINGKLKKGNLKGDLIVIGGGDPTLGSSYFNSSDNQKQFLSTWVEAIKANGINDIKGDLIIDASLFADSDVPRSWIWEDLGNYYGAAAKAISIYDNTMEIEFETGDHEGDSTKIISLTPSIYDIIIKNEVLSSSDQRDRAYVFGDPNTNYRSIRGTLPMNRESFKIKASIPNPADVLASDFTEMLNDSGVFFNGNILYSFDEKYQNVDSIIYRYKSPVLAEIIQQTNFESINLYAEVLGKYLGLVKNNNGNTEAGCEAIESFWDSIGVELNNWYLADGSGLSRMNSISTNTLTNLLVYMASNSKFSEEFHASIPVMGQNGTQKYYFRNSVLNGKARAKSGSMNRIRSFAGYMTTKQGKEVAFSVIANNFKGSSMQMAHQLEKVIETIYQEY